MSNNSDDLRRIVSQLPQLQRRQQQEVEVLKSELGQPDPYGIEAAAGLIYLAYPDNTAPPNPRSLVGDAALNALVETLVESGEEIARLNAAWALGVVGIVREDVITALIDALELDAHDLPDRAVAEQAAQSLARLDEQLNPAREALGRWREKARRLGWGSDDEMP